MAPTELKSFAIKTVVISIVFYRQTTPSFTKKIRIHHLSFIIKPRSSCYPVLNKFKVTKNDNWILVVGY
jgi:hypothetical protein